MSLESSISRLSVPAFRYALGRQGSLTAVVAEELAANAAHIDRHTRRLIRRELATVRKGWDTMPPDLVLAWDAMDWAFVKEDIREDGL